MNSPPSRHHHAQSITSTIGEFLDTSITTKPISNSHLNHGFITKLITVPSKPQTTNHHYHSITITQFSCNQIRITITADKNCRFYQPVPPLCTPVTPPSNQSSLPPIRFGHPKLINTSSAPIQTTCNSSINHQHQKPATLTAPPHQHNTTNSKLLQTTQTQYHRPKHQTCNLASVHGLIIPQAKPSQTQAAAVLAVTDTGSPRQHGLTNSSISLSQFN
jgi:hypothetical protein